ncbi:MCE family protein [Aeromicrobium sp. CTD01-1L150]|uniref:MCE family protein n=1 Tax=Aeromicrobium sp. CTD01-1L150 TaxID=3341830 RepID=UPI0035BFD56F
MSGLLERFAALSRMITVLVVLLLVAGAVFVFVDRTESRTLTVDFPRTNSLYEGSDVKILGVNVGTVDKLTPRGETVRAEISYPKDVRLPDDVKAVIVSPSIVGDRFVQLAPAFDGGAELKDGASLGPDRTEVPVELDEVYGSLDDLSVALGPDGANSDGALSRLVDDTAAQLDGQGAQLNQTIRNFGQLGQTLSDNKDDLFGTVREVSQFVELLDRNDSSVRAFFDSTAEVSEVLEGEREDLALTLEALGDALVEVRTLVRDNREELRGNVDNLQSIAEVLAQHEQDIEGFTVNAPTALSNVALTYNGEFGTLDNHADVLGLLTGLVGGLPSVLCNAAEGLGLEEVPVIGDLLLDGCRTLADAVSPVTDGLADGIGDAAGSSGDDASAEEEVDEELLQQLREGLGAERTGVTSGQSPDRTQTSLEEMLAVQ